MDKLKYIEFKHNSNSREINNSIKDIISFCEANKIEDIDYFIYNCMMKGFYIEKYGLLNDELTLPETIYVQSECEDIKDEMLELQNKYNELNETFKLKHNEVYDITNKYNSALKENQELKTIITSKLGRYHQSSNLKK